MPQSYTSLWFHLVWSTKNREPFLQKSWKWKLFEHIKQYCESKDYHLDHVNSVEDHIHILISLKPTLAISDVVRNIKTDSYYWIKVQKLCGLEFGWQDGYGAFTVSNSALKNVRNYIRNQEQHHNKISSDDEFKQFCKTASDNQQ